MPFKDSRDEDRYQQIHGADPKEDRRWREYMDEIYLEEEKVKLKSFEVYLKESTNKPEDVLYVGFHGGYFCNGKFTKEYPK